VIAVISDVHGNTPALRATLNDIYASGAEHIYFLGDAINGVDPAGTLELLQQSCSLLIKGNVEQWACDEDLRVESGENRQLLQLVRQRWQRGYAIGWQLAYVLGGVGGRMFCYQACGV
jgi:predicted phosphodiesterase